MFDHIASMTVHDILQPKPCGSYVNSHVIADVREPAPDFEAMRRLVLGRGGMSEKDNEQHESD